MRILERIVNKKNVALFCVAILGFIWLFCGMIQGFEEICTYYNTTPDYWTIFTTKECVQKIDVVDCLLPVPDVSKCQTIQNLRGNLT